MIVWLFQALGIRLFVQSAKAGVNDPSRDSLENYYMLFAEIKAFILILWGGGWDGGGGELVILILITQKQ